MSTAVVCGECGKGNFALETSPPLPRALCPDVFECTVCGDEVTRNEFDVNTPEGESLVVIAGVLHVVTES
jgi:hypothetical protein